ncbi:hypothetical protein [Niveispirillum sp.]|uniref:hypothetical protein n=1 Tax=Niveispirillum sp. TaxID=1917217 RepID=UPI001B516CA7|nr:hypothetical protein [Niveispirillum sp.]MBP7337676.1 hypothetical protein [Niveispirillum sp.]
MTPEQRTLARHALGLPNDRHTSYRNRFITGKGSLNHPAWAAMVAAGDAECSSTNNPVNNDYFWLTRQGAEKALNARETLCSEDFPNTTQAGAA